MPVNSEIFRIYRHLFYGSPLRKNYDGFSFDQEAATHVFCPWSVLNFFKYPQQGFKNYWYVNFQKSGNSTP